MAYSILSMEKVHVMGDLQTRYEHNFREMVLPHVDYTLSSGNEELVNFSGLDYKELWYNRVRNLELETGESLIKRKNSVIALEFISSFSRGAEIDIEAWKKKNVEWMKNFFGEDNVLSMQLHVDETTYHIHSIVIPIDERGHLCAKSFTGGRAKMRAMRDSFNQAMKEVGLEPGERYSKTKKENLGRFYNQVNKAVDMRVPSILPGEMVDDYVKRVNEYIQDMQLRIVNERYAYKRRAELAETRLFQFKAKYREAVSLQDEISEGFGGDYPMTRDRIRTYRKLEHAVPRKTLWALLDNLIKKFPVEENVVVFDTKEKRKKKKSEEIPVDENIGL